MVILPADTFIVAALIDNENGQFIPHIKISLKKGIRRRYHVTMDLLEKIASVVRKEVPTQEYWNTVTTIHTPDGGGMVIVFLLPNAHNKQEEEAQRCMEFLHQIVINHIKVEHG